ncbi:LOW QUALITY PROTEIN: EF-hand and coiled-coil domain-containing protein 1-like [Ctenodactylus gundi]
MVEVKLEHRISRRSELGGVYLGDHVGLSAQPCPGEKLAWEAEFAAERRPFLQLRAEGGKGKLAGPPLEGFPQRSARERGRRTLQKPPDFLLFVSTGHVPGLAWRAAPLRPAFLPASGRPWIRGRRRREGTGRPGPRPAWRALACAAHDYGLDRGVENEVVVLATGLDQHVQDVFHHPDPGGTGRLPRADFRALCAVLGLRAPGAKDCGRAANEASGAVHEGDADAQEEARRAEPPELTFRQFHARLCSYFGTRAGPRLPRGALCELIETQIRLRRPRSRRRPRAPGPEAGPEDPGRERAARLEDENGSLRELVEDLRAALQSSDARCLALHVGLWKSRTDAHEAGNGGPEAAAVVCELPRAQGSLAPAEALAGQLRRGLAEVRRRTEEAREAACPACDSSRPWRNRCRVCDAGGGA